MKVLLVNSVCGIKSTGRICADIATDMEREGHTVKIAYGRETVPTRFQKFAVRIGTELEVRLSGIHTRLTDRHGFSNKAATKKFLRWAEEYNPDLLWLHNLHGYYINIEMLFEWIKSRPDMQVKWTLHDCWAFTGHCSHFERAKCQKWMTGCGKCMQTKGYPKSMLMDNSKNSYIRKKQAFVGVKDMKIITPSRWLADLVKKSFLSEYPIEVVCNTIDLDIFKPTCSDFREKNGLLNKKIILGVASDWGERKGLKDFYELSDRLDSSYKIVLVGLSKQQSKHTPSKIITIERTNSAKELAQIYTAADVFLNLTYEDNYPTVNLESQACGTPIITYRTGGSVESVPPENVAEQGNLDDVIRIINRIISDKQEMYSF